MGIGPAAAGALSYWEYAALLHQWNARHDPAGEPLPITPPAADVVRARQARLAARGIGAG